MNTATLKTEITNELNNIITFWLNHTADQHNGGFLGRIDYNNQKDYTALKGSVLNARILWSFSAASLVQNSTLLETFAKSAFDYIRLNFVDPIHGGVYWTLNSDGSPAQIKKQVYAQAFSLYACAAYYKLNQDASAIKLAIDLFRVLEQHCHDDKHGGYYEAFDNDWACLEDVRLSDKDVNASKSMNTNLHVLEAYTQLYIIWPDDALRKRIIELLDIFKTKIIHPATFHLRLFFDDTWNSNDSLVSFGHDIEASWLLLEAAEIIKDDVLIQELMKLSVLMAKSTIKGIDGNGGLFYEWNRLSGTMVKEKHWWVQAEALVGFFSAWQISGDEQYLQLVFSIWDFIKREMIDYKNGEWFWGISSDGELMNEDKIGLWKCPYHNSRACLELLNRIK